MTINEYINECQNYEYSQEYYDIIKECAQLELLERYLTNQEFIKENSDLVDSNKDYFQESTNDDNMYIVEEQVADAQVGIFTKVMTSIGKMLDKQTNALQAFGDKTKTRIQEGIEDRKLMKPFKSLSPDQKKTVGVELNKILKAFSSIKFVRHGDKPIFWEMKQFIPEIFGGKSIEELNGVPSNLVKMFNEIDFTRFSVSVVIPANAPIIDGITDIDGLQSDIKESKDSIGDDTTTPTFDDNTCKKILNNAAHDQNITIELSESALDEYIKACKELSSTVKKFAANTKKKADKLYKVDEFGNHKKTVSDLFRSKKAIAKRKEKSMALMDIHNKLLIITEASGNTIAIYKELTKYLDTIVKVQKSVSSITNNTN